MEGEAPTPWLRTVAVSVKRARVIGLLSLTAGDSTTRSGAGGGRMLTPMVCVAVSPPGSLAVTVTVAVPAATAPMVKVSPETDTPATPASDVAAA